MKDISEEIKEIFEWYGLVSEYERKLEITDEITALINDNYYCKEFVKWYGEFVTEVHGQYGLMQLPKEAMMAETHDKLFEYWKTNFRDK